jgi:hypothetical protein
VYVQVFRPSICHENPTEVDESCILDILDLSDHDLSTLHTIVQNKMLWHPSEYLSPILYMQEIKYSS